MNYKQIQNIFNKQVIFHHKDEKDYKLHWDMVKGKRYEFNNLSNEEITKLNKQLMNVYVVYVEDTQNTHIIWENK